MVKYYPNVRSQGKGNDRAQQNGPNFEAPKRNRLYALKSRGEQESSLDVVTGMLKVFSINVYAFLDPGATLSFLTPLVAMKFYMLADVLYEPFPISTSVCDSLVS